ncbi:hypothetical protein HHI36_017678 [Cryptolaemus montrouzieri]|uniref:Uncharacterized protein n=1 Tax=Cryptolaemus montrouzieri TaxID=559131 RepID=A0ABD2NNL9_9CUCU
MKQWITQGIRISTRRKNFLYHLKNKGEISKGYYEKYSGILKRVFRAAKLLSSGKYVLESKNKCKPTWTHIRQHTQANMKRNTSILEEKDKQFSPEEILNTVNKFFLSQGTASKMFNEPSKQTSEQIFNNIVFLPTDVMGIERIILALRDMNSTSYDEIPVKLLKHEIAKPLSSIINS